MATKNKGWEKENRGVIITNHYYQLLDNGTTCNIYSNSQPICYFLSVDIDQYFFTFKEERELKLTALGV